MIPLSTSSTKPNPPPQASRPCALNSIFSFLDSLKSEGIPPRAWGQEDCGAYLNKDTSSLLGVLGAVCARAVGARAVGATHLEG